MGKLLDQYRGLASPADLDAVRALSTRFQGRSVLHVCSGRLPVGIQGMLERLSGLFTELGIRHGSTVIAGSEEFVDMVRISERGLDDREDSGALRAAYLDVLSRKSSRSYLSADLVVVHGLQALGLIEFRFDERAWAWRCHSDLSATAPGFWALARPFAERYQAALFSHGGFVPELDTPSFIVPPSVDPFSEPNWPMTRGESEQILGTLGVPPDRLLVLQFLSRGTAAEALEAVRMWKGVPAARSAVLVLVGLGPARVAEDVPEFLPGGQSFVDDGLRFVTLGSRAERELRALGWAATAAVDASTSRWPNPHLLDLLWKAKPVLVPRGSGNGRFVPEEAGGRFSSMAELAWRLTELLGDGERVRKMGEAGRDAVLARHLPVRHVLDYLKLLLYFEDPSAGPPTSTP